MRYPEAKIKEAILHPDAKLRARAVAYFADAFSPDPTVMPLVIRAVATYGREDSFRLLTHASSLRQTEETVAWLLRELPPASTDDEDDEDGDDPDLSADDTLGEVLATADLDALQPHLEAIEEATGLAEEQRDFIFERLETADWDLPSACEELEAFCAENQDEEYDIDWSRGRLLAEAVARFGAQAEGKILEWLARPVPGPGDPTYWLELFAIEAAGRAGLGAAVPALVEKMLPDNEVVQEECVDALVRLGTPGVVDALIAAWPGGDYSFRLCVTEILEKIHGDQAVAACVRLLDQEENEEVRQFLVYALVGQFASEAIDAARKVQGREPALDDDIGVVDRLLENCEITGERFPEYEDWKQQRQAERQRWDSPPAATPFPAVDDYDYDDWAPEPPALHPFEREAVKVGRNDPCPCGSGKKFKNCCLKKTGAT